MKLPVPWWARIGAKIVLSTLPASYDFWRRLDLFKHGAMNQSGYAQQVFELHFARAGFAAGRPFTALELGPGDSLLSAVIAASQGCTHIELVDTGAFATTDMQVYRAAARDLKKLGFEPPDVESARDVAEMLARCNARYATDGLASLQSIPTASIDFLWSHAVLEHVRRNDFSAIIQETRRVLRPGGICSHEVDLRDHLGGSLNNLRIGSEWWERDWVARSGFYTNRLRKTDMMSEFTRAGFEVAVINETNWREVPLSRSKLAREFSSLSDRDLITKTFHVTLKPV